VLPLLWPEPWSGDAGAAGGERWLGGRRIHPGWRGDGGVRVAGDRRRRWLRGLVLREGRGRNLQADRCVLAPLALEVHVYGSLARGGPPLGACAQAPDFRADGGDSGGTHDGAAGGRGRGAQLGLPLHLDQGRSLHPLRPAAHRAHRGGQGVHGLDRGPLPELRPRWLPATDVRVGRAPEPDRGDA
jgi:hypothetical protein